MKFLDIIKTSGANLWTNKGRTILTATAIFIGAFTIALTMAVNAGVNDYIDRQLSIFGDDSLVYVRAKSAMTQFTTGPQEYKENATSEQLGGISITMLNKNDLKKIEDIAVFSKGNIANGSKNMMKYNPQGLVECGKIRPPKNDSVPSQSTIGKRPSRANAYKQDFTNYPTDLIEFTFEQKPIHPTQKPLDLMKYFISTYSDENDYVLDNTMGSGTTCLAAKELNRKFIGIEKEAKYYEIACQRCGF